MTPDWFSVGGFPGTSSYHRTSDRPPVPATVCEVHTTVLPIVGSIADTAWVSRPSSRSSVFVEPFCGAPVDTGGANDVTVTDLPFVDIFGTVGSVGFGFTVNTVICVPVPQMSGHSMSEEATTKPVDDGSVWIAGTGVNVWVPSPFFRPTNLPDFSVLCAGHVVMVPLPCGFDVHRTSWEVACRLDSDG